MDSRLRFWVGLALSTTLLAGCTGGGGPKTVPVSGKVTYQGQAVVGAQVVFMAPGAPRPATGVTDGNGVYRLGTLKEDDGAVIGTHAVTITKTTQAAGGGAMNAQDPSAGYGEAMDKAAAGGGGSSEQLSTEEGGIPAQYADSAKSGLKRDVTEAGPNEFNFELED